jgi:hypothetical protein
MHLDVGEGRRMGLRSMKQVSRTVSDHPDTMFGNLCIKTVN